MDFADILRSRKMVRNYTDEPVRREFVERIVQTALASKLDETRPAPSG